MAPELRKYLNSGNPIEVHCVYCAGPGAPAVPCGHTVVLCDDYELAHPLDGGGVVFVSGACLTCGTRCEFCAPVPWSKLRIPSAIPGLNTPPQPQPPHQENPGGDDEPDVPE